MFNYYTERGLFGADYSLFLKPILATGKKICLVKQFFPWISAQNKYETSSVVDCNFKPVNA